MAKKIEAGILLFLWDALQEFPGYRT